MPRNLIILLTQTATACLAIRTLTVSRRVVTLCLFTQQLPVTPVAQAALAAIPILAILHSLIQPAVLLHRRLIAVPVTLKQIRQQAVLVAVAVMVMPAVTVSHLEQTVLPSLTGVVAIQFIQLRHCVQSAILLVVLAAMQITAGGIKIQTRQL